MRTKKRELSYFFCGIDAEWVTKGIKRAKYYLLIKDPTRKIGYRRVTRVRNIPKKWPVQLNTYL